MSTAGLGWWAIVRLGLVQTCLGAIIVLTTSTLNRVMVVELALPAMLPGFLVGLHHTVQMLRPRFGHGSDVGGRTTGWIIGGMFVLALSGVAAATGTALAETHLLAGVALSIIAFVGIGLGAGAAGTCLLVTLAKHVAPERKAAAATIVWIMMIAGFAITAGTAGHFLDPYSPLRLVQVTAMVAVLAVAVTMVSVFRLEPKSAPGDGLPLPSKAHGDFRAALRQVWAEPEARRFTVFVFISMMAYSAQDLILEPFAGTVFAMTPGQSTQLAGIQHSGVLLGMLIVAISSTVMRNSSPGVLRLWTVGGCLASALALAGIVTGGAAAPHWPLSANVFLLGLANGAFAVAAIASMMTLAGRGAARRDGLRMGIWGAAQAIAFALGGFLGTVAVDVSRLFTTDAALAYGVVFSLEAALFVVAAIAGARVQSPSPTRIDQRLPSFGEVAIAEVFDGR